jgi:hypothetical protein
MGHERGGLDALRVRVEHAPLAALAPIVGETQTGLVARLRDAGFVGVTAEASPAQIALATQQSERAVLEALIDGSSPRRRP